MYFTLILSDVRGIGIRFAMVQKVLLLSISSIKFLGSRARPVRRADNLTTNCERVVKTMWDS
jgi:hypothetical protein